MVGHRAVLRMLSSIVLGLVQVPAVERQQASGGAEEVQGVRAPEHLLDFIEVRQKMSTIKEVSGILELSDGQ